MNIAIFSFTRNGTGLSQRLRTELKTEYDCVAYAPQKYCIGNDIEAFDDSQAFMGDLFKRCDVLLFIGATGIAVRKIAPFIKSKDVDPAVICIDEKGLYCIPLLSGHIGGANKMAEQLAKHLQATAIITTATDLHHLFSVDGWATENGYAIENIQAIKHISGALLDGEPVGVATAFPIEGGVAAGLVVGGACRCGIVISDATDGCAEHAFEYALHLVPKCITVGVGCRRGVSFEQVESLFLRLLEENHLSIRHIKCLATIDLKKDEPALKMLAQKYKLALTIYTPQQLKEVPGDFTASAFVNQTTGVDNVCERAAVKAADNGTRFVQKTIQDGVTMALAKQNWIIRF